MQAKSNTTTASPTALLPLLRALATALLAAMEANLVAFGGAKVVLTTPATREEFDFAFRVVARHFELAGVTPREHGALLVATYASAAARDASPSWAMHAINVFAAKFPGAAAQLMADAAACLPGATSATAPAASEGVSA